MQYVSTRGEAPVLGFSDAVLAGLARDGGLYVPGTWPQFSAAEIRAMRGLAYPDLAIRVLTPFLGGEIAAPVFERLVREAYATFRHEAVCPLVQTGKNIFILELFSNVMRLMSLSVRLFANILAGHLIILFMGGALAVLLGIAALGWITVPLGVVLFVFEVGLVAGLQAFIFATLTAIYLGGAVAESH